MNQLIITTILWLAALPSPGTATHPQTDFLAAITAGKVTEVREMRLRMVLRVSHWHAIKAFPVDLVTF